MTEDPILKLARPEILQLQPYSSARKEVQSREGLVWLDANENSWSYANSPYNRYPDPQPESLLGHLARIYGVDSQKLVVGRGTDEIIDLLVRVFCRPGEDAVLAFPPTFGMYKVCAQIQGARYLTVPLSEERGFQVSLDEVEAALTSKVKIVFLCSPNNPTGHVLSSDFIHSVLELTRGRALVVLDEAYIEFAQAESMASEVDHWDHLVVLRTLSKAWGMAGARVGCGICDERIVDLLRRVLPPYPLSTPSLKALLPVLSAEGTRQMEKRVSQVRRERRRLVKELKKHPEVLKIYRGEANFILLKVEDPPSFREKFLQAGVVIRDRSQDLEGAVRITVGTPWENDMILEILGLETELRSKERRAYVSRITKETNIVAEVNLDNQGDSKIDTGIGFYDHMLEQVAKHGGITLYLKCKGDLEIDAHHTIEDCALTLGLALKEALGDKRGIRRYGFLLPMDESLAQAAVDLSGRPACQFKGDFPESQVGGFPTEMVSHFFQSLADSLGAAIHMTVEGENTHHMVEACFKALGRCFRMAFAQEGDELPSTKGVL